MFKLMIADDNPHTLLGLSEGTDWEKFDFILTGVFQNGKDLLEAARSDMPDLVITDISMPQMDGITLASELYSLKSDIKIIFISSYSEFDYARTALKLRIFDYILKPIQINQLEEVMSRLLERLNREHLEHFEQQQSKLRQEYFRKAALSHYISRLLFHVNDEQYMQEKVQQLGLSLQDNTYFYVVCYALDTPFDFCGKLPSADYFRSILECAFEEALVIPVMFEENRGVFLLLPHTETIPVSDLLALLGVDIESKTNHCITMGYSNISQSLTELPKSYQQAQTALQKLLEADAVTPIASYADVYVSSESAACTHTERVPNKIVSSMRTFIEEHYAEPITTNDVACSVYLSPNYANRCFAAECGITIFGYIVQYRLEKAKELLRDTNEHITRIAEHVGYSTKTSFYLAFKRHTGMSPTEYRQKHFDF